jgi:4a-hydroxytetrahydrobiopterin dehydratase
VVAHRAFLEAVADRAELDRPGDAKRAAQSVLVGIARRLDQPARRALEAALPTQLAVTVEGAAPLDHDDGKRRFLQTVASELDVTPQRARLLTRAVLAALAAQDGPTARMVRRQLSGEFLDLVPSSGDVLPPRAERTAALPEPTDLTPDEVSEELASLPGWTGDVHALERTVVLPPGVGQELRDRIARVERAMNHRAVVEERPDGTVFRVWTHARGLVTDVDIELAHRISRILDGGEVDESPL